MRDGDVEAQEQEDRQEQEEQQEGLQRAEGQCYARARRVHRGRARVKEMVARLIDAVGSSCSAGFWIGVCRS